MKIMVLGAGLVGGPMAADLAADPSFEVTAVDVDAEVLARLAKNRAVRAVRCDLTRPEDVRRLVAAYDLVLSAVPGFMGFRTLQAVIEAKKNVVDIAFFPEDPFALDALARANGVTALVDCGVAPGMSNVLTGFAQHRLDEVRSVLIYVGGLPLIREWPYDYKAVFSPVDVIEEYIRPARYVQNGVLVVRPALSDAELLNFPGLGTLEAFNTDGLRTLIGTIAAPDMKEKTLRYPGHIEKMAVLRETGFFSQEEIEVGGVNVRPLDVTAKLLFPKWKLGPADRDITVMKIVVEGKKDGRGRRFTYNLLDRFDEATGIHSMARTTGYTAAVAARMLARGLYAEKGIGAPEFLGRRPECVEFLLAGLKERGIIYNETVE
jgi:lysine 6-dehydrogenase